MSAAADIAAFWRAAGQKNGGYWRLSIGYIIRIT
jgi:hypothetical protein